jgi:hypothetical protein
VVRAEGLSRGLLHPRGVPVRYELGISLAQTARRKKRFDTNQHRNTRLLEG